MKTTTRLALLICLSFSGAMPVLAAKGAKAAGQPAGPALPSVRLRHLIDETLPKIGRLAGENTVKDRTTLIEAQADYTAKLKLASPADQPMYQASVGVLNALVGAVDEHDKAVANYHYSKSVHGPQDKKDLDISNTHTGWGSGRTAEANNAKENKENSDSRKALLAKEQMMNKGTIDAWTTRAGQIRASVEQAYAAELVVEKQTVAARAAATAALAPPVAPPRTKSKPQPPKTEASAAEQYSPVGTWPTDRAPWIFKEDNTFTHGSGAGQWAWKDQGTGQLELKWRNGKSAKATFSDDGHTLRVEQGGGETTLKR